MYVIQCPSFVGCTSRWSATAFSNQEACQDLSDDLVVGSDASVVLLPHGREICTHSSDRLVGLSEVTGNRCFVIHL